MLYNLDIRLNLLGGFLEVALPQGGQLRVWSPWNPASSNEIHALSPNFDSTSIVLAGEVLKTRFRIVSYEKGPYAEHVGFFPTFVANKKQTDLVEIGTQVVRRGELYRVQTYELHRTEAVFGLELFLQDKNQRQGFTVYTRSQDPPVPCAKVSRSELEQGLERALRAARLSLEDIIALDASHHLHTAGEECLDKLPMRASFGYHLREIPRSPHGTVGKVVEEALELADAQNQEVRIMSLCECADVVSALRGYLRANNENWEQVLKMSEITDRVFACGDRQ